MSTMIFADFLTNKKSLGQQLFIALIVGCLVGLASGSVYIAPPMVMFMIAIGQGIGLVALDEQNGWESYRNALPLSRASIIAGRMVFIVLLAVTFLLIGDVVAVIAGMAAPYLVGVEFLNAAEVTLSAEDLAMTSISSLAIFLALLGIYMPFIAKMGMTRAVRVLPLVFVFIFLAALIVMGGSDGAVLSAFDAFLVQFPLAVTGGILVICGAIVFVVGGFLAIRFYEAREF